MEANQFSTTNPEWRVKDIPFRDNYAPMETNWGAVFGAMLFLGGILAGFHTQILFVVAIPGFVIGLVSILFRGRIIRRNWKKLPARCIDREWKQVFPNGGSLNGGRSKVWTFRILCEFSLEGKKHTVTPGYWSTFISESRLTQFLDKVIAREGQCMLWVNPNNPLQAELCANDITEILLH